MKKSKKLLIAYNETQATIPYFEYTSKKKGKRIVIISGVHGDEINGIKIIYDVMAWFDKNIGKDFCGSVVFVPIVNVLGYAKGKRRIPVDNVDLNRSFFSDEPKSFSTYFAKQFFHEILEGADAVLDIHDAGERDVLPPHSRFFPNDPLSKKMAKLLGTKIAIKRKGKKGMLAKYLEKNNIPSLTIEVGGNKKYNIKGQKIIRTGIVRILNNFGTFTQEYDLPNIEDIHVYTKRHAFKASMTGLVEVHKELNEIVMKGEVVGTFFDPLTERKVDLISPVNGIVFSIWTANSAYKGAKIISFIVDHEFDIEGYTLAKEYDGLCTFDNSPM